MGDWKGLEPLSLCHCMPPNTGWANRGNTPRQKNDGLRDFSKTIQPIVYNMYPSL